MVNFRLLTPPQGDRRGRISQEQPRERRHAATVQATPSTPGATLDTRSAHLKTVDTRDVIGQSRGGDWCRGVVVFLRKTR